MATLDEASDEELERLLDLFPIVHLRAVWADVKDRKKRDLCGAIAKARPISQIAGFVSDHFGCCRQHVYVYVRPDDKSSLPTSIIGGERVGTHTASRALYLARVERGVVLVGADVQKTSISFLWPVLIEFHDLYVVVRFVVLEKDIKSYFDVPAYPAERGLDEKDVLAGLIPQLALTPADIQKGVKALWQLDDYMDGHHTKYKTADSVASETMNDGKGIKKHKPKLYQILLNSPLTQMVYKIDRKQKSTIDIFGTDPSEGTLSFPHYSDKPGDSDRVVREILQRN